jgi:hypothetical protein
MHARTVRPQKNQNQNKKSQKNHMIFLSRTLCRSEFKREWGKKALKE